MRALVQALQKFGVKDDVRDLMEAADADGDGQIDFPEFIQLLRETSSELAAPTAGSAPFLRPSMHAAQNLPPQATTAAHG